MLTVSFKMLDPYWTIKDFHFVRWDNKSVVGVVTIENLLLSNENIPYNFAIFAIYEVKIWYMCFKDREKVTYFFVMEILTCQQIILVSKPVNSTKD